MAFQAKQLFFEKEADGFTVLIRDGAAENGAIIDSISVAGEAFENFLEELDLAQLVPMEDYEDDDEEEDEDDEPDENAEGEEPN